MANEETPHSGAVARSAGGAAPAVTGAVSRVEGAKDPLVVGGEGTSQPAIDPKTNLPITKEGDLPAGDKPAVQADPNAKVYTAEEQAAIADPKFGKFTKAFIDTGTLTEAEMAEAATASGLPVEFVKQYVAGQAALRSQGTHTEEQTQAIADQTTRNNLAYEFSKDNAGWLDFAAWTQGNLTAEQRGSIEAAVKNGHKDPNTARVIIGTYYGRFKAAAGGTPRDVTSQGASTHEVHSAEGYASQADMVTAMQNPKYNRDPVYTAEVVAKVAASNFK